MAKITAAALVVAAAALAGTAAASGPVQAACPAHTKRAARAETAGDALGTVVTHPSGLIRLGINNEGNLNWIPQPGYNTKNSQVTNVYGLRYVDADPGHILNAGAPGAEYESTSPGCLCEGWGAGAWNTAGNYQGGGWADESAGGYVGLTVLSNLVASPAPNASAQSAISTVKAGSCLRVEHNYFPSTASRYLYEVDVTLTNVCDFGLGTVKYIRVMDWDVEPTVFNELVDLNPGNALDLECLHDDGFEVPDVTSTTAFGILQGPCLPRGNVVTELGAADHGAYFRFNFHDITNDSPLAPGASKTLKTFYGAAPTRALALSALGNVGAEAYSFGHSTAGGSSFGREGYTTIFAFSGIGGSVVVPDDSFTAPCTGCNSVRVESDGTSVTLDFAENGPYTATCQ